MGVTGLWQLIESVGTPVKVDKLEGKRLGVDANIWLYKFIRGFREGENSTNLDAHKLGLFHRICKLLFYKIKPVFVFDGPAPILKRRTLERRQNVRNKHLEKVQDAAMRLLAEQLEHKYPEMNLSKVMIKLPQLKSNNLVAAEKFTNEDRELFYLPPKPEGQEEEQQEESDYSEEEEVQRLNIDPTLFDARRIDIQSQEFSQLPPEIRYETLQDVKESTRKIRYVDQLPEDATSFSNFQLDRLRSRRVVQEKIEQCEKEIQRNFGSDAHGQVYVSNKPKTEPQPILSATYHPEDFRDMNDEKDKRKLSNQPDTQNRNTEDRHQSTRKVTSMIMEEPKELPKSARVPIITLSGEAEAQCVEDEKDKSKIMHGPVDEEEEVQILNLDSTLFRAKRVDTETQEVSQSSPETRCETLQDVDEPRRKIQRVDSLPEDSELQSVLSNLSEESQNSKDGETENETEEDEREEEKEEEKEEESGRSEEEDEEDLITVASSCEESSTDIEEIPQVPLEVTSETIQKPVGESEQVIEQTHRAYNESNAEPQSSQFISYQADTSDRSTEDRHQSTRKVTSKITEEAKELLRLFGVPFIVAGGEAEAQCAVLEELKLTEGTITDDSDIWLFGARNVYRHFFNDKKNQAQLYKMADIEAYAELSREKMVCLAMLVGSDYTDGVAKVGPVTAMKILSEFPGDKLDPLIKFKEWRDEYASAKDKKVGNSVRKGFLKYRLPDSFPSHTVFDAYLHPAADSSTEKFVWGTPDLDELREYARRNFGWSSQKADDTLLPVIKRVNESRRQLVLR